METLYYLSKGQKTVGPCTFDDLHSYLAYGSVQENDLVRRDGTSEWMPLASLEELNRPKDGSAALQELTTRRRTTRFRDYARVPYHQRSGVVLKRLFWGFFLFPPWLWKGSMAVFRGRIFTPRADDKGYLRPWPRWIEPIVTVLMVANSLLWLVLILWAWQSVLPWWHQFTSNIQGLENWKTP
ncbi:MAG TPA: DUF4339 domain-containing protein [Prosthecobacter sp.]